jgi:asparagine synthetase B (glutamine-hydrolysing)
MCGVLLIDSAVDLDPSRIDRALTRLRTRGPDLLRKFRSGNLHLYHSVLHVTGNLDWYHIPHPDWFAYNGEIYGYQTHGHYANDVELAHETAQQDPAGFRHLHGPWAWIHWDQQHIRYASDPQGERFLYRYQDSNTVIVASEVALIRDLVDCRITRLTYQNKCWSMQEDTPYEGIQRLRPGVLYQDHKMQSVIDDVWGWVQHEQYHDQEWREQFSRTLDLVMQHTRTDLGSTVSFGGGVDSALLSRQLVDSELISIDMIGKDPNIPRCHQLLTPQQISRHRILPVTPELYAQEYQVLLETTLMPAQSWSFVGKWLVAKHAQNRVIYTGLAADELFGGYAVYRDLTADSSHPTSPYSRCCDPELWQQSLEVYHGDARPATLIMDYWYQVVGVDSPGQDRIAGAWGRETRNPFMHPSMIKLALNLPWHLRVNTETKVLLKEKFRCIWPESLLWPKQGFAGHANDSLPWMSLDITATGDRHQDWKQIAIKSFYQTCQ